jgi:hypothetical protein
MNQVSIPPWAIELGKSRSGLSSLNPTATALIVVDLQNAFLAPGELAQASSAVPLGTIAAARRFSRTPP